MNQHQNRKLRAILFADIAGYTAMMQTNENTARQWVQKFRETLTTTVEKFEGTIIQFYGDGCLCVFESALNAVNCAKEIQKTYQSTPTVPVRIGLHSGEVFFEADNVYGDAVNIASRVESMGVSGAVLLSSNVRNQIKNKPEFELVSLGRFEFKNVKEGMTVYALGNEGFVVPEREAIKGKLKERRPVMSSKILMISLPIVLLMAIAIGWFSKENFQKNTKPSSAILNERIAILPFKNNTNNTDLDILGDMAADWITRGLMEIEDAEVVSPHTVRQHLDAVGILPNNREKQTSFSELTGAGVVMNGNYYQEKEEVIFNLQITDAEVGKILYSFEPVRGSISNKEAMIENLRETISGYWVARGEVNQKKFKAPKYEAYKEFLLGNQDLWFTPNAFQKTLKAAEIDSTFYWARLVFISRNRFELNFPNAPHLQFLNRHKNNFSSFEKVYYNFCLGNFEGNYINAYLNLEALRKKFPKDYILNTDCANVALAGMRNPKLSLTILNKLDDADYTMNSIGPANFMHRTETMLRSLYLEEKYEEAIGHYKKIQEVNKLNLGHQIFGHYLNLIKLGKSNKVLNTLENILKNPDVEYNHLGLSLILIAKNFKLVNQPENVIKSLGLLKTTIEKHRKQMPLAPILDIGLLELSEQWEELLMIDIKPLALYPYYEFCLFSKGLALIKTDQPAKLNLIFEELDGLHKKNSNRAADVRARVNYTKGLLFTQLGEKENAVKYLKLALEDGIVLNYSPLQFDPYLKPLHGYPPYEALLKPIEVPLPN